MHKARLVMMDPNFNVLGIDDDFITFECSRAESAQGAFSATMLMRDEYEAIGVDYMLELQRSMDGGNTWANDLRTLWFVRKVDVEVRETGKEIITISGHDSNGLLARRIVAYFSVQDTDSGQNYYSIKTQPSDDAMREVVRENFTSAIESVPGADLPGSVSVVGASHRIMERLLVEGNRSEAAVTTTEIAWSTVEDALSSIADAAIEEGERLLYDVVYGGDGTFTFVVRKDILWVDRSSSVVFSLDNGNVSSIKMTKDYTGEVTWMHVGGEGQAEERLVAGVVSGSFERNIWYPIEGFTDVDDSKNDQAIMEAKGRRELNKLAPRWVFSAQVLDVPHCQFGIHYGFGDRVGVSHRGIYSTCRIGKIRLLYDGPAYPTVEIPLESEEIL